MDATRKMADDGEARDENDSEMWRKREIPLFSRGGDVPWEFGGAAQLMRSDLVLSISFASFICRRGALLPINIHGLEESSCAWTVGRQ